MALMRHEGRALGPGPPTYEGPHKQRLRTFPGGLPRSCERGNSGRPEELQRNPELRTPEPPEWPWHVLSASPRDAKSNGGQKCKAACGRRQPSAGYPPHRRAKNQALPTPRVGRAGKQKSRGPAQVGPRPPRADGHGKLNEIPHRATQSKKIAYTWPRSARASRGQT